MVNGNQNCCTGKQSDEEHTKSLSGRAAVIFVGHTEKIWAGVQAEITHVQSSVEISKAEVHEIEWEYRRKSLQTTPNIKHGNENQKTFLLGCVANI